MKSLFRQTTNSAKLLWNAQSTVAANQAASSQEILPFESIPSPPSLPLLGHIPLMARKSVQNNMDHFMDDLHAKYGDLVRLNLPGTGNMLFLFNPDHFPLVSYNESRIPNIPIFEIFNCLRKEKLGHIYKTSGLLSNSEDWYNMRKSVQKIMLRPENAMQYATQIEDVVLDVIDVIEKEKNDDGSLDISNLMKTFATDAISVPFLGHKIGALRGDEIGLKISSAAMKILGLWSTLMYLPLWVQKIHPNFNKMGWFPSLFSILTRVRLDYVTILNFKLVMVFGIGLWN